MTWVSADGLRPAGWSDGDPWRDPVPLGPSTRPPQIAPDLLSVYGRRTRPEKCRTCGGVVVEYVDSPSVCTRRINDGGCGGDGC